VTASLKVARFNKHATISVKVVRFN
jgi:hypothetical protein